MAVGSQKRQEFAICRMCRLVAGGEGALHGSHDESYEKASQCVYVHHSQALQPLYAVTTAAHVYRPMGMASTAVRADRIIYKSKKTKYETVQ